MNRRKFVRQTGIIGAGLLTAPQMLKAENKMEFPVVRVPKSQRKFTSPAIENVISQTKRKLKDPELAWLFENCFPNTLDTTVDFEIVNGQPDTYVITGDIDAMWLRDSSAQVWPYLPFMKDDKNLQPLIKGVIRRQTQCILLDPYANAFYKDPLQVSEWKDDLTVMKPGIHERKWEIDSLCYPIRLSLEYWKQTKDHSIFDQDWQTAMALVLATFKEQQRLDGKGPYSFQRRTSWATDGVPLGGYGYPVKPNGLICSMFRPSDDATVYPYLIPSNFFAVASLRDLAYWWGYIKSNLGLFKNSMLDADALAFCKTVEKAFKEEALIMHKQFGKIFAYEVNGMGSVNLMDDANIPSLLALPYLDQGFGKYDFLLEKEFKDVYKNTRRFLFSDQNPFFFRGKAAEGIGGPHVGMDYIWPMSIIMRAMTSTDDAEIRKCIQWLKTTHAGTGFMHESFHKDDPSKFTRKWFAWANTLFGELILKVVKERPHLV